MRAALPQTRHDVSLPSDGRSGGEATEPPVGPLVPPAVTCSDLLRSIEANHLVRRSILESFRSAAGRFGLDVEGFAQMLVEGGHLTRWQVSRLLAGKSGFHLGKYKLLDRIGAGGMGVVLKAEHTGLKRVTAVKVLSRTLLTNSDAVRRFSREVEAAAALDHPNIVRAFDADCIDGVPFLVMEFVEGKNLGSLVADRGPLPIDLACGFCRQAALGLQHAHERGLVHRDIKPANLLLTRKSPVDPLVVKILDFGLARFTSETAVQGDLTALNRVMGTVDYISPEQAQSSKTADIRADLYSLGCTLFHLLTQKVPFPGENVIEKLTARLERDPLPLRSLRPDAPAGLEAVLNRVLARDPADRFQTPRDFADALEPFSVRDPAAVVRQVLQEVRRSDSQAEAPTESELALERFLLLHSEYDRSLAPPSSQTIPRRRRRVAPVLLALVALILAATAVGFAFRERLGEWIASLRSDERAPERFVTPGTSDPLANGDAASADVLFTWRAGDGWTGHAASAEDGSPSADRPLTLVPSGAVTLDGTGTLEFRGGRVQLDGASRPVLEACTANGAVSWELGLRTAALDQIGPARILSMSTGAAFTNFLLGQEREWLVLRLPAPAATDPPATSDPSGDGGRPKRPRRREEAPANDLRLCRLTPGRWQHVVVGFSRGTVVCWVDGVETLRVSDVVGDLSTWVDAPLLLGDDPQGSRPWRGSLAQVTIRDRLPTADEVRRPSGTTPGPQRD